MNEKEQRELVSLLPKGEREVIEQIFFQKKTEIQIAIEKGVLVGEIYKLKTKGIERLQSIYSSPNIRKDVEKVRDADAKKAQDIKKARDIEKKVASIIRERKGGEDRMLIKGNYIGDTPKNVARALFGLKAKRKQ